MHVFWMIWYKCLPAVISFALNIWPDVQAHRFFNSSVNSQRLERRKLHLDFSAGPVNPRPWVGG